MEGQIILLLPIVYPILAGMLVLSGKGLRENGRLASLVTAAALAVQLVFVAAALARGGSLTIWKLTDTISLTLRVDGVSRLFAALTCGVWLLGAVYSVSYLSHEARVSRFCGFYLIVEGALTGLDFSADLITMYVFFEMMTLTSLPLVLHEQSREAVRAGMKYLFYSVAGAFMALFGILFLAGVSSGLAFSGGGILTDAAVSGKEGLFKLAAFCMILGFGPGERRAVRTDHKIRGAGDYPGRVFYYRRGTAPGKLGAVCVDCSGAFDSGYGLHAGLPGAVAKKTPGLFHREPGIVYFIWLKPPAADGLCGRAVPYCISFHDKKRAVFHCRRLHCGNRKNKGEGDTEAGGRAASDAWMLYHRLPGPGGDSPGERLCQQMVSGRRGSGIGYRGVSLHWAGGAAGERAFDSRISAPAHDFRIFSGRGARGRRGRKERGSVLVDADSDRRFDGVLPVSWLLSGPASFCA